MGSRRALSLQVRQLLAAGLGLVAFLGLTGFALDRAFTDAAVSNLRERLQTYAHAYLAGSDLARDGVLIVPEVPPEPRFAQPGAGLYASVRSETFYWESPSSVSRRVPFDMQVAVGDARFEGPLESDEGPVFRFGLGVAWQSDADDEVDFSVIIVESAQTVDRQVAVFRRTLWVHLGAAAALLLAVQILISRWSLQPLRTVVGELSEVERGQVDRLRGSYPRELALLTNNINELIESEREHLARYRNTLGDLAHSLKTPLAVLRTRIENENDAEPDHLGLREDVRAQVARMDGIVAYQLARAATTGHLVFAAPIPIAPHAEALVQSLEKVYARKNVLCEFDLDSTAHFFGELGDLLELLGNLLENAFKWADHRVLLSTQTLTVAPQRRAGLLISVEDDGPGIPADRVEHLLQRGVRGDERVQGHGIGLSIVQDIVRAYRGELSVERSEELGGARFVLHFSPAA
jgi:two-component system, OmpR family, sensor histidine kinase PhoQ